MWSRLLSELYYFYHVDCIVVGFKLTVYHVDIIQQYYKYMGCEFGNFRRKISGNIGLFQSSRKFVNYVDLCQSTVSKSSIAK